MPQSSSLILTCGRTACSRSLAGAELFEWGIYIERDSYRFAEFDLESGKWLIRENRPFAESGVPDAVALRLKTDGVGELPFADGKDLPQIVVFSSGEVTPFTIFLEPDWDTLPWLVSSDGISRVVAVRDGDSA